MTPVHLRNTRTGLTEASYSWVVRPLELVVVECRCFAPPFNHEDFDSDFLGVDETRGNFAEVTIETCKACGARWLRYFVENEAFPRSGRWYRGLVSQEALARLTPEQAPELLASLPWHFYGGSYFDTTGRKGSGPLEAGSC